MQSKAAIREQVWLPARAGIQLGGFRAWPLAVGVTLVGPAAREPVCFQALSPVGEREWPGGLPLE